MKTDPILIFGMDRSGTSVLGSMVKAWGAHGGRSLAVDENYNEENPNENRVIINFLSRRLFDTLFYPEHNKQMQRILESGDFLLEFENLLQQEMSEDQRFWFIKDPLLALILPVLNACFPNAAYIIPVRDPYESALSWEKFLMPRGSTYRILYANLLRWQSIMTAAISHSTNTRRLFISFEKLHSRPQESATRLAQFLDGIYQTATSTETITAMASKVNRKMYRSKYHQGFLDLPEVSEDQKRLYRVLLELEENPARTATTENIRLPAGWGEHVLNSIAISKLAGLQAKSGFPIRLDWIKRFIERP